MKSSRIFTRLAALMILTPMLHAADAPKPFEVIVDKTMKAYNEGDSKAFFADYAKAMASIASPAMFDALYKEMALKQFGKYVSKSFIAGQSVVEGETPLLVFEAKFEKNPKVKLAFNFMKEEGKPKVMQVTIEKFQ